MTAHHFEIGLATDDLRRAAAAVSSVLDVQLDEVEGDIYGGHYFHGRSAGVTGNEVFVNSNFDAIEGEWHAPDDQDMPIVAKVFNSERAAGVVAVDLEEALSTSTRVIGERVG